MSITYIFSERIGRKRTYLLLFSLISAVSLVMAALTAVPGAEWGVTIGSLFMRNFAGCGVGVMTTYISEIFPANARSSALGAAFAVAGFFSIAAPYVG